MDGSISALSDKMDKVRDGYRDGIENLRKVYDERFGNVNVQIAMMQVKIAVGATVLSLATSVLVSWLMKGH